MMIRAIFMLVMLTFSTCNQDIIDTYKNYNKYGPSKKCLNITSCDFSQKCISVGDKEAKSCFKERFENVKCRLVELQIREPIKTRRIVDLLRHCSELKVIFFQGDGYDCKLPLWKELSQTATTHHVVLFSKNTSCIANATQHCENRQNGFLFQVHCMGCKFVEEAGCKCNIDSWFWACEVDCAHKELDDSQLPRYLPFKTTNILLNGNKLIDPSSWLRAVLPKLKFVKRIFLQNNQLQKPPILPTSGNEILHIYLTDNNMTQLNREDYKTYLQYRNLSIYIKDNPWKCDCVSQQFIPFIQKNLQLFGDYYEIMCEDTIHQREVIMPWMYEDNDYCKTDLARWHYKITLEDGLIAVFVVANLVMFFLTCNVHRALKEVVAGDVNARTPWIHHIVLALRMLNPKTYIHNRVSP